MSLAKQMAVKADAFDVSTTLALILHVLGLLVPFPIPQFATLLHSLILLRVIPSRLISHSDLCLVLLIARSGSFPLSIEQVNRLLRQCYKRQLRHHQGVGVGRYGSRHKDAFVSSRVRSSRRA